jgi:HAMP domain-containing protein
MKTVTIEIKNDIAMSFLHNLESMDILRVIENKTVPGEQKLSERFAGCLSKERTEELQKELIQMRNEWERDTY